MKKKQNKSIEIIFGYVIFFLTVSLTVTVALIAYENMRDSMGDRKGTVALAMLAVIIFVAFACTVIDIIRRSITVNRPVARILAASERIMRGDFSVRLEIKHQYGFYNEFDLIMENLNILAEELGKKEVLNTEFISNVSHELKTPIAVIKSTAELLAAKAEGEAREELISISEAAGRLALLIGNVLKLNKLENGGIMSENDEFSLSELLTQSLLLYTDRIDEKEIELELEIDEGISVLSSSSNIEIIFNNLISNAVKFTERGGKISVGLSRDGVDAVFFVRDTGCGISAKDGARIFEKFYQIDGSHSGEGNGLGLPLVRKVVEVLGGDISVESEPGVGSIFTVRLKGMVV